MTTPRPRSLRGIDADYAHSDRVIVRVSILAFNAMVYVALRAAFTGGNPFGGPIDVRSTVIGSLVAAVLFGVFLKLRSARLAAAIALWSAMFAAWNGVVHQHWISVIYWLIISACGATCVWHLRLVEQYRNEYVQKWTPYEIKPGDVFTVRDGDAFAVVKTLAVDPDRVHVRQYALRYPERPWTVKSSTLLRDASNGGGRAFAHLPLDLAEFVRWDPWLLRNEPVSAAELKPLEVWRGMQQRTEME